MGNASRWANDRRLGCWLVQSARVWGGGGRLEAKKADTSRGGGKRKDDYHGHSASTGCSTSAERMIDGGTVAVAPEAQDSPTQISIRS